VAPHCLEVEAAIRDLQVRQVLVAGAVAQQEFCSTIPYCLLPVAVAAAVAAADSVLDNRHLVQEVRPMPVYMQVRMVKITPATAVAGVVVAVVGLGATVEKSGAEMLAH
jgi:hypothetical protein